MEELEIFKSDVRHFIRTHKAYLNMRNPNVKRYRQFFYSLGPTQTLICPCYESSPYIKHKDNHKENFLKSMSEMQGFMFDVNEFVRQHKSYQLIADKYENQPCMLIKPQKDIIEVIQASFIGEVI